MKVKKFNEMYSEDDVLETIRDILDSQILDEFDLELGKFGWGVETKFIFNSPDATGHQYRRHMNPDVVYQYELPDGEEVLINDNSEQFDGINILLYEVDEQSDFLIIEFRCIKEYFMNNLVDILNSIKSSISRIESMTYLRLGDLHASFFKNSITFDEWWDIKDIDWKSDYNYDKINEFLLRGPKSDNMRIQIFLK